MTAVSSHRFSFLLKPVGALLLVALADLLFWMHEPGSTIGLFAFSMILVAVLLRREMLLTWPPLIALAAALTFALSLGLEPGPLALLLFWTAITIAALLPRTAGFDNGLRWALRLIIHGLCAPLGPIRDLLLARRARQRRGAGLLRHAVVLIVPAIGTAIFLFLFAQANPLIEQALARLDMRLALTPETIVRTFFWTFIFLAAWSLLRPTRFALWSSLPGADPQLALPGLGLTSVVLSLIAFNAVFAMQNGLDLIFLWSGAPLPEGMTLAEYAHRGAYPLIATALLAGLFVLVALRPGSDTAASRPVRLLVTIWIAQNILLVASTMLRTLDYVEAYSLTRLRIAALIWMALVGVGLVLICYRLLRGRSGAWLVNANLLAAALVLGVCTFTDLGRIASGWNVRHAREVGGGGAAIDLCYLNDLGHSALLPLLELETRRLPADLRPRVQWVRTRVMDGLVRRQADWHSRSVLGTLRLAAAEAIVAANRLQRYEGPHRMCDGNLPPPPPIAAVRRPEPAPEENAAAPERAPEPAKPLTPPAQR